MFEKNLFGLEKNGDVKVWLIRIEDVFCDHPEVMLVITHGKEGGKLTVKNESVTQGKQGRTVYEQAVLQAEARIKKQLAKNYRENRDDLFEELPIIAMLAKDASMEKLEKVKFKYKEGILVSDKLDGFRCLAKCFMSPHFGIKTVTIESRTGEIYKVPHIEEELLGFMEPGDILDGELYVHGPVLEEISSAVKRTDPQEKINETYLKVAKQLNKHGPDSPEYAKAKTEYAQANEIAKIRGQLEFRVFDFVTLYDPFVVRLDKLNKYADERFIDGGKVFKVAYITVFSKEELRAAHKDAVERGFEGVMVRTLEGEYESGKRSGGLWKYKEFMDAEFQILDIVPDKQGHAVFVLRNNKNGNVFQCVMGDMEQRAYYLANKHLFIGKWLMVKFQSLYKKTLIPQFPTGIMFRECDEQGNPVE
jgi:DNA ligase-1